MKKSTMVKMGVTAALLFAGYKLYKKCTEKPFDPEAMYDYEDNPYMTLDDYDDDYEEDATMA